MPIERLPERWRPSLRRLRDALMTDAGVMVILGVVMIARGVSYAEPGQHVFVHPLDVVLPLWVPATVWVVLGGVLILASRWHSTTVGRTVLAAAVGGLGLWGSLFIFAPPAAFSQRGIIYLGLAAVIVWAVWRGRRGEIRVVDQEVRLRGSRER